MNNTPIGFCKEATRLDNIFFHSKGFISIAQLEYSIGYWATDVEIGVMSMDELKYLIRYHELEFLF